MLIEAAAASSLTRLVQPLVKDVYEGAKKAGARGLLKWEQKGFAGKLGRRIRAIEDVRTLWRPDGAISLREFFHPPKLVIDKKPVLLSRLTDLPSNAIVIEGIVGQGKSILLRSLAIEEIRSNDAKRIPVFIELKNLNAKLDLRQAIIKHLEGYDIEIDDESLEYLYRSGRFSLLLDGFDEIEENLIKSTFLDIEQLALRYPDLQIVVTSRLGHEIQKSSQFKILQIAQLLPSEFAAFLSKLQVSSEKSLSLRQAIKNSPSKISSLITTPLMLTLVVIVYEAESQIPETLPEFFERLFQVVFSRHDHLKAAFTRKHHSGLSERRLQILFESFCFMTLQLSYGRTLTQTQFDEVFDLALDYADGCSCEAEKFKQDITKVACLMLEDGIDSITFLHKSILEYYAAAFVKGLSDENAQLFYEAATKKSHGWEEVLTFLRSIDSFRYSRHYLLPATARERDLLVTKATGLSDEGLSKLVSSMYPGLGIYFRTVEGDNSRARVGAYGAYLHRAGEHLGSFGYLLMDALNDTIPNPLTVAELMQKFGVDPRTSSDEHGVHVAGQPIFKQYGVDQLRKAVAIYDSRLIKLETAARSVIELEQKKSMIFAKKKSR